MVTTSHWKTVKGTKASLHELAPAFGLQPHLHDTIMKHIHQRVKNDYGHINAVLCTALSAYTDNPPNYFAKGRARNVTAWAKIQSLAQYFEGIGVMLQSNSVEIDQVYRLLSTQIIRCWEKLQSVILEQRQRELDPRIYSSFESLYYAIKKYEQAPSKTSDDARIHRFED
jgi:hypothetical protein